MEFSEVINKRYSVRGFKDKEVEGEKLDKIIESALMAPTAVNFQPFKLYIIDTKKHKEELNEIYKKEWFTEAPIVLGLVINKDEAWTRPWDGKEFGDIDAGIIMTQIILQATDLGLGTCFIGAFDKDRASEFLDLDSNMEPILFTPLGYSDAEPRENTKKSIDELIVYK